MANTVRLESQIWSVMESLSRAAVDEICKLVEAECVEMRLEIRRGQSQIESLKTEIRGLKEELGHDSAPAVSLVDPHPEDRSHEEQERGDMKVDRVQQDQPEEENKVIISELTKNLQGNLSQGCSSHLSPGNEQSQASVFSLHVRGIQSSKSHILSDLLSSEDIGGIGPSALKVESENHSFSAGEGNSEAREGDQMLSTDRQDHLMVNQFDAADFQPRSHYSSKALHRQPSGKRSHSTFDPHFGDLHEQWKSEDKLSGVVFKTEQEEVPLGQTTNQISSCAMTDSNACLSFPEANYNGGAKNADCSSGLWQNLPSSHINPQPFRLDDSGKILDSHSVRCTAESRAKETRARKNQERFQTRTFKQNSASLSMILAKAKSLPRPNMDFKTFSCSFCPKTFHSAADLKRHQRIHTGEKPFGCGVCGKRFSLRGNLITHERSHSGSKPFVCQLCGRGFTHSSNLNAHRRVHTGERPFHCSLCGETFAWQHPFKRHLRLHCQYSVAPVIIGCSDSGV